MKKLFVLFIVFIFFPANFVSAAEDNIFKAEVVEILEQKELGDSSDQNTVKQNIRLKGIEDGQEYFFYGLEAPQTLKNNVYKPGDKVMLLESFNDRGEPFYYIQDYIRSGPIYLLFALFVVLLLLVGGKKTFRSLLSLFFSFFIIIKFIIPLILSGYNPFLVTLFGGLGVLLVIIYFTEGFRLLSHLSFISISASLVFSIFLSWSFLNLAQLSGLFGEEVASLTVLGFESQSFQGLLLAGIIIGLLGVLDDVVISQVATVEQIYLNNTEISSKNLFKSSFKVGISHISSMTNTLFLAYAGASLPLLVLISSGGSAFDSFFDIINNEAIATEIVRTLSGSIGLLTAIPFSTFLAVWWFKK